MIHTFNKNLYLLIPELPYLEISNSSTLVRLERKNKKEREKCQKHRTFIIHSPRIRIDLALLVLALCNFRRVNQAKNMIYAH